MRKGGPKTEEGKAKALANLRPPWKPGESGNKAGEWSAGANVKHQWNRMADWSRQQLERVSQDETETVARRAAANRWLAALESREDLNQIISHTDGSPAKSVDVNVSGGMTHTHAVRAAMDRLKADPQAMSEAHALARRLLPDDSDGANN